MAGKNILTIDISNIDFNAIKFKMIGSLTLDKVKIKYNWIFNANIKDAIIGEDENGLVWYSGTWLSGTWEDGTWYSGIFIEGRWKAGNVYSYDIDFNQLLNGVFYIYRTDISKTYFVNCTFDGGNFNYGIFGNIKNSDKITLPYNIDRDFIINNIEDYEIESGFNVGANIGFDLETQNTELNAINTVAFDSDNNILVGGKFSKYNNLSCSGIIKLMYDGTLISNFNGGFNTDSIIRKIIVDSNNKILVCGDFSNYNNKKYNNIIRLNSDGSVDDTFVADFKDINGTKQIINTIEIDSNNKILVGGNFSLYNNDIVSYKTYIISKYLKYYGYYESYNNVVKMNVSGITNIIPGNYIYFSNSVSTIIPNTEFYVINIESEIINNEQFTIIYIQVDNNFDKTTLFSNKEFYIINNISNILRLNNDGSIDTTFISNGFNDVVNCIKIDNNNKIMIGGRFTTYSSNSCNGIGRIEYDGAIDTTFNKSYGFEGFNSSVGVVNAIEIDTMNNIYVGGNFSSYTYNDSLTIIDYKTKKRNNLIKLLNDGTVDENYDTRFDIGFGITYDTEGKDAYIKSIIIDSSNKIIIGGHFDAYNSNVYSGIVRLNSNGSIDDNFDIGYGIFNNKNMERTDISAVNILKQDINNKIYVGGTFDIYNAVESNLLIRTNYNGGNDNVNNKIFKDSKINKAIFKSGTFINGLFNSAQFLGGNFMNGYFNNSLWNGGNWYNGEFLGGEWYDGEFLGGVFSNGNWYNGTLSNINKDIETNFGLNYKNKSINAANWYGGKFSNGNFYSVKYETLDATQSLKQGIDVLRNNDNSLVNWYRGIFSNGNFYGGKIHDAIWDNGIMYDGNVLNIIFNNGHIVDTYCEGGIFNGGTVGGGIFDNILVNNLFFGYEI